MEELTKLFRIHQGLAQDKEEQKIESLHLDATEREIERNVDPEAQKEDYSGKQGTHTLKNSVICDEFQFIHFAGFTHRGAIHDKAMIEQEIPHFNDLQTPFLWFTKDKGYQAYCPEGVFLLEPYKAARNHPLTGLQKLVNSWISSVRVVCEHAISGIKRCRLLKEPLRYFDSILRDQFFFIACGLHILRVTARKDNYSNGALRTCARINLIFS